MGLFVCVREGVRVGVCLSVRMRMGGWEVYVCV